MTELSPEAKDLLREARTAFSPPDGRLEAVRAALKVQMAASGATLSSAAPASGVATRAIGATGWGTAHAIGAAVVIGALGAGGIGAWLAADRSPPTPLPTMAASVQTHPTSAEITSPIEPSAPIETSLVAVPTPSWGASVSEVAPSSKSPSALRDRTRVAARPRGRADVPREAPRETPLESPSPPIEPAPDSLAEEVSVLRGARAALDRGDAAQALRLLEAHETRFQRATLYEERLATRVLALCALGRIDAARSTAQELERAAPRSPHLPRVRASCIAQPAGK